MNKILKNSELIKRFIIIAIASILLIISLVFYCQSYSVYDDGFGTDISFDMDYAVLLICSTALLIYGIYSVYAYKKNLSDRSAYYGSFGVISVIMMGYPLGTFFKAMAKGKDFADNQGYLIVGIIGLAMVLYLAFSYLAEKRK